MVERLAFMVGGGAPNIEAKDYLQLAQMLQRQLLNSGRKVESWITETVHEATAPFREGPVISGTIVFMSSASMHIAQSILHNSGDRYRVVVLTGHPQQPAHSGDATHPVVIQKRDLRGGSIHVATLLLGPEKVSA